MQNKTTLKTYFETGDMPTQAEFKELIDSYLNFIDNKTNIIQGIGSATGSGSARAVNLSLAITSLVTGGIYLIKFLNSNSVYAQLSLSVNGIVSKEINERDGNPLFAGAIKANQYYPLIFNGTNFIIQSVSQKLHDAFNVSIPNNAIISGGIAVWDNGMDFNVSAASYYIQSNFYQSSAGSVTLDTADPTDDRFDVIALNDVLQIVKITGTPATDPAVPNVDLSTQVFVTSVLVKAGQSQPEVTIEDIYLENTEWITSDNDPAVWDRADTSDPYAGTKAIKATIAGNGDYVDFESLNFDLNQFDVLTFRIKVISWVGNRRKLNLTFEKSSNQIGSIFLAHNDYGFDVNNLTDYQEIIIPVIDFGLSATIIDKLIIATGGIGGGSQSFLLDNIILQSGLQQTSVQNIWKTIEADVGSVSAQSPIDLLKIKGARQITTEIKLKKITIKITGDQFVIFGNPTINDDSTKGHFVGSIWINPVGSEIFMARDVSVGNAVWLRIDNTSPISMLDMKDSVMTVADTNITRNGNQTINGYLTVDGDRVGLIGQTAGKENGIWISDASFWTRSTDADEETEVTNGLSFFVSNSASTKNGNQYILINPDPIVIDVTPLTFIEILRIELGTTAGTAAEGNDPRIPTQDENDALEGSIDDVVNIFLSNNFN